MAPGGKTAENIGLEFQDDARAEYRAAADQGQRGKITGAEVGNDQESHEEDGGGAEVTHQAQAADAHASQGNKQGDIPLV